MTPLTTRRQTVNPEFWAIIGVGIALAGLQWRLYATLNTRMDRMETRIDARIDALQRNVDAAFRHPATQRGRAFE